MKKIEMTIEQTETGYIATINRDNGASVTYSKDLNVLLLQIAKQEFPSN